MPTDKELMQIALNALEECYDVQAYPANGETIQDDAIKALRARLAQPDVPETAFGETEPVAWMHNFIDDVIIKNRPTDITCNAGRWTALYTSPPQRQWQGLTAKDLAEIPASCYEGAIWADAKLKEKNT